MLWITVSKSEFKNGTYTGTYTHDQMVESIDKFHSDHTEGVFMDAYTQISDNTDRFVRQYVREQVTVGDNTYIDILTVYY